MRNPLENRCLPVLLLLTFSVGLTRSVHAGTVTVDAGRGPVSVHVPAGYDPDIPLPLVMLLHGYSENGPVQEAYMQFTPLADARGFLYLYPNGSFDGGGNRFWAGTNACCDFAGTGIDDSGYLRDLIEAVGQALHVDERRVYLIGHSNGGFMSYRMACDHPDLITAIASLAGATWNNPAACAPASGVHVLQIHGTADGTISYNGGNLAGSVYPGAVATVQQWANFAGCNLTPDNSAPSIDLEASIAGNETTVSRYTAGCNAEGSAELWTIPGGSHIPNLSNDFSPAIIDFLFQHARAGIGTSHCTAAPNSAGPGAHIAALGSDAVADDDLTLLAEGVPASVFGLFFFGPNAIQAPFGDGFRCVGGATQRLQPPTRANTFGTAARTVSLTTHPAAALIVPASTWSFQFWYRDLGGPGGTGFNLTDGCTVTFQ